MSELGYYETDLGDALTKLEDLMAKYSKASSSARQQILREAELKAKEAVELRKGYQLAIVQALRDDTIKHKPKLAQLSSRLDQLQSEVRIAKQQDDRIGLFGPSTVRNATPTSDISRLGNSEVLNRSLDIQNKTEASLNNTQRMIAQSKEIGDSTARQLQEQRHQILQITEDVMHIDDSLVRAQKLLKVLARRIATDRLILVMAFLVFAAIVGIVVYKMINPDDTTFYVPDEVMPPDPVEAYNSTVKQLT